MQSAHIAQNLKTKLRSFLGLETGLRRVPRRVWGRPRAGRRGAPGRGLVSLFSFTRPVRAERRPARGQPQTLRGTLRRPVSRLKKDLHFIFKG